MINSIRQEVVTEFANTGFSSKLVSSVMYGSSDTVHIFYRRNAAYKAIKMM